LTKFENNAVITLLLILEKEKGREIETKKERKKESGGFG
jgi:hypothetical protein